jgi:hypothetical protein
MEEMMMIEPPFCPQSIHNLLLRHKFSKYVIIGNVKESRLLCNRTSGVENAKHVDIVDLFKVGFGEFYSWFDDSYTGVLNGRERELA